MPNTAQEILKQSLWLNKHITINNNCAYLKAWQNPGI